MILWKYGRRVVRDSQESDLKVAGSSPVTVTVFFGRLIYAIMRIKCPNTGFCRGHTTKRPTRNARTCCRVTAGGMGMKKEEEKGASSS